MSIADQLNRSILLCRDHVAANLTDQEICHRFQSTRVLLVSNVENLLSHSGQTAVMTTISLMSRMGVQICLAIPEVEMIYEQPPFEMGLLRRSALASSGQLISIATVDEANHIAPDLTFLLGDTKVPECASADWRLVGEEWCGALIREGTGAARSWKAQWPIGAMVSASLAAGEVFKHVMRGLPFRFDGDQEFFQASQYCAWDFGAIAIPRGGIDLGSVDIVSAGAISQATLFVLTRLPGVRMTGRIFDEDVTGVSNFNRNMLTVVGDLDSRKANLVSARCSSKFSIEPILGRFTADCREAESLAPVVLVGVDDIPSRWQVQARAPGMVVVSGTSHYGVSSSLHRPSEPCSGCLHPVDDVTAFGEIPTVSFVSFWAGLMMTVRVLRESLGKPYTRDRQHLWLTPLRMDLRNAAMWSAISPRTDCPVGCAASRVLRLRGQFATRGQYHPDSCA